MAQKSFRNSALEVNENKQHNVCTSYVEVRILKYVEVRILKYVEVRILKYVEVRILKS